MAAFLKSFPAILVISTLRVNSHCDSVQEIVSRMSVVTIRDVAQAAGVSLSSVSRALNGGKNVSARIARDVTAAADRLGYQPDFMARSLRTRSTGMVGCLVSDVANPLNASIVQAAEARLREAGYLLVVASTANDPARERAAAVEFRGRRLDGMLVAPGSDANAQDLARARRGRHGGRHPRSRSPGRRRRPLARRPGRSSRRREGGDPISDRPGPPAHRAADGGCAHAPQSRADRGLPGSVRRGGHRSGRRAALHPGIAHGLRARRYARPPARTADGRPRSSRSARASWRASCARRAISALPCPATCR